MPPQRPQMVPQFGMPSSPMPPPAPPPAAPPPQAGGLGPSSPLAGMLSDLSPSMGPGWQSVDLAVRALRVALRSTDFQKSPAVVAVVQSVSNTLAQLVTSHTSGTAEPKKSPPSGEVSQGSPPSSDADSQPAMAASGAGSSAEDV